MTKPLKKKPNKTESKVSQSTVRRIITRHRDPVTGVILPTPRAPGDPQPVIAPKQGKKRQHPKDAVLDTFADLGGKRWLKNNARKNPKDFIGLLSKAVSGEGAGGTSVTYIPVIVPVEQREVSMGVLESVQTPVAPEPDPFM